MERSRSLRLLALGLAAALPVAAFFWMPPIVRGPSFHDYADRRALLGIPFALDVLTNLPFVLVGLVALVRLARRGPSGPGELPRWMLAGVFLGIAAIGLGSGNYHLHPRDSTLVWDFLPIVVLFMAFLAVLIGDRVSLRLGAWLYLPLVALAAASAFQWYAGARRGQGDLRFYVLVQGSGAFLVALVVLLFPRGRLSTRLILLAVASYLLARVATALDRELLGLLGVSGHSLKHLLAALGTYFLYRATATGASSRTSPPTGVAAMGPRPV